MVICGTPAGSLMHLVFLLLLTLLVIDMVHVLQLKDALTWLEDFPSLFLPQVELL